MLFLVDNSRCIFRFVKHTSPPSTRRSISLALAMLPTHTPLAFLIAFRVFLSILLQVIVARAPLTFPLFHLLLVVKWENLQNLWFNSGLREQFVIRDTLAHFMRPVDILHLMTVPCINLNQPLHQLSLQFNDLSAVERIGDRHSTTDTDSLMLVKVYFRFDILKYFVLLVWILREHPQVFVLFHFYHLYECLTHLPILVSYLLIFIQSRHGSSFLLE